MLPLYGEIKIVNNYRQRRRVRTCMHCSRVVDAISKVLTTTTIKLASCNLQAASCKSHAQYYASEGCKTCASVAGLVASFIVVVIGS